MHHNNPKSARSKPKSNTHQLELQRKKKIEKRGSSLISPVWSFLWIRLISPSNSSCFCLTLSSSLDFSRRPLIISIDIEKGRKKSREIRPNRSEKQKGKKFEGLLSLWCPLVELLFKARSEGSPIWEMYCYRLDASFLAILFNFNYTWWALLSGAWQYWTENLSSIREWLTRGVSRFGSHPDRTWQPAGGPFTFVNANQVLVGWRTTSRSWEPNRVRAQLSDPCELGSCHGSN